MVVVWHGIRDALLMAWEVWWALVAGFAISAIVQAWVPRERIERAMGADPEHPVTPVARATALGAASSSCSYAAVAIARSLLDKGASLVSALAFQFASTNLVWELGLVLWVLIGWQFTVGEYLGGIVMIVLMAIAARTFVSPAVEREAREHAHRADPGHQHHHAGGEQGWRARLTSIRAWSDVAHNFRGDWQMLWREIALGFVLAGFIAQVPNGVFRALFITSAPAPLPAIENAVVGPVIAVLSFVCSVGNVPLAAVLWSGGIGFSGVLAFLFADLIVLPIVMIYRKYYGGRFAWRITALMFCTMVIAALIVAGVLDLVGAVPSGPRPTRANVFSSIEVGYKLWLNVAATVVFVALTWLTMRRGALDPVCGMRVDRAKAVVRETPAGTRYFCSEHCASRFDAGAHARLGHEGHAGHAPASH
ncbi:MAG TPA: permease [Solirubrobacteraceae bacterium]|nr:permease [Solirubrobacteraceae bacterium]